METKEIYPSHSFYAVTVAIERQIDDSGKTKKAKEVYLVDAQDVSDAEKKTISLMVSGVIGTWEIEAVSKSKVCGVVTA